MTGVNHTLFIETGSNCSWCTCLSLNIVAAKCLCTRNLNHVELGLDKELNTFEMAMAKESI